MTPRWWWLLIAVIVGAVIAGSLLAVQYAKQQVPPLPEMPKDVSPR